MSIGIDMMVSMDLKTPDHGSIEMTCFILVVNQVDLRTVFGGSN